MEQIEETNKTSMDVDIYEPHMSYIYDIARKSISNISFDGIDTRITIHHSLFLCYLIYGYIEKTVERDIVSIWKNIGDVKRPHHITKEILKCLGLNTSTEIEVIKDIINKGITYDDIKDYVEDIIHTTRFFKNIGHKTGFVNDLYYFKSISLSSLKVVYINIETEFALDVLCVFPCNIDFYLNFPMKRGCVKHLRKNIGISYSTDNVFYGDFYSYIGRVKLYQNGIEDYYTNIDHSSTKQIAVHSSRLNFFYSMIKKPPLREMHISFNKRLSNLSKLVCTAKLDVVKNTE